MKLYYRYYTFYMYLVLKTKWKLLYFHIESLLLLLLSKHGGATRLWGPKVGGAEGVRNSGEHNLFISLSLTLAPPCEGVIIIIITHSVYIYDVDKLLETNNSRWGGEKRAYDDIYKTWCKSTDAAGKPFLSIRARVSCHHRNNNELMRVVSPQKGERGQQPFARSCFQRCQIGHHWPFL